MRNMMTEEKMRRPIFQHIKLEIYTLGYLLFYNNTTLYHWGFFHSRLCSFFLIIQMSLTLACFCILMCICASEQQTQITSAHYSYERSQVEQHQILSGMISSSYVTLVSQHWQSQALWHHLCLDRNCKVEGCWLYLKANMLYLWPESHTKLVPELKSSFRGLLCR